MSITRLFLARPTLVFVTLVLIFIAGAASWMLLPRQQFPNVDFPTVTVTATYNGASATQMRDSIVKPLEDQIAGAPDLDHIDSSIQNGKAFISATFSLTSEKNADLVQMQQRVQAAQSQLPTDLKTPTIQTFDPSQSVVVELGASSKTLTADALATFITERIVPEIEQIDGVSTVQTRGLVTPALVVSANPAALDAHGATLTDLVNAVANDNQRAPGGYATAAGKETSIDVRGDIQDADSVARLLVNSTAPATISSSSTATSTSTLSPWSVSTQLLHVGDVATVAKGFEPQRSYSFANGKGAVTLDAIKSAGASEVTVSNAVIADLPTLRKEYPAVDFTVTSVGSAFTSQQIDSVTHTLAEGIMLTAIVMVLFLASWRNALVVLVAIPTSLCIALFVMKLASFTLDTISLMAMTLVIGILVDDSIVVLENVTRHRAAGEPPREASLNGRAEIGLAAVVVTLVDVVVFLPIALLPGQVGRVLSEFAVTVVVSTLSSLLVSFTITPSLAGNWSLFSTWKAPGFILAFDRGFERIKRFYTQHILDWALRRPLAVIAACALLLIGSIALVPLGVIGAEFIPASDRGQITIQFTFPAGISVAAARNEVQDVERYVDGIGSDLQNEDISVSSNVKDGYAQSNVQADFLKRVDALHLPADIIVAPSAGGTSDNLQQTVVGMAAALGVAVLMVYFLMVALFNSYRSPAIILFALPMAFVGALGALAITRSTLNLFSLIGVIMLVGLVMKNGILLVDFANRARENGKSKLAAILAAADARFRPIVMTTIAMIAGMLPLALGLDAGAAERRSLGIVVIGGLSSSLLLTLVLVPIAYVWLSPAKLAASHSVDASDHDDHSAPPVAAPKEFAHQ